MDLSSTEYKRAFEAYMRFGTPIDLSLKRVPPTTHYIWRMQRDGKVRPSHAANDGRVFAWDAPPATGHPGEDYGCRCTAEPYKQQFSETFDISLQGVSDTGPEWTRFDYSHHYYFGGGKPLTLRETGNLVKVVAEYRRSVIDDPKRLPGQIADAAREDVTGFSPHDFDNTYPMRHVVYSLGDTTIGGIFSGRAKQVENALYISGSIKFFHEDEFRDPLNIGYVLKKLKIDPLIDEIACAAIADGVNEVGQIAYRVRSKIGQTIYNVLRDHIEDRIAKILQGIRRRLLPQFSKNIQIDKFISKKDLREFPFSQYYDITDKWTGILRSKVYFDKENSKFTQ